MIAQCDGKLPHPADDACTDAGGDGDDADVVVGEVGVASDVDDYAHANDAAADGGDDRVPEAGDGCAYADTDTGGDGGSDCACAANGDDE